MHAVAELERGRASHASRAWKEAHESLSHAERATSLKAEDLELLATSAYMLGRDDDYLSALERAHHAYADSAKGRRAVRCAFWIGLNLLLRGEMSRATAGSLVRSGCSNAIRVTALERGCGGSALRRLTPSLPSLTRRSRTC
jgi:hypothetical protein